MCIFTPIVFISPRITGKGFGAKHVHFSPDTSRPVLARVWVYHNSFAGGGWACDVGFEGTVPNMSMSISLIISSLPMG